MEKRVAVKHVLDKHRVTCQKCGCPEAVVLVDTLFNVGWQCVDCEFRWPATGKESAMLLDASLKTIH